MDIYKIKVGDETLVSTPYEMKTQIKNIDYERMKEYIKTMFNGVLILEELKVYIDDLFNPTASCDFLKYQDEEHYLACCLDRVYESSIKYNVKLPLEHFEEWSNVNELNIDTLDICLSEGHKQMVAELELKDYLTEVNIKKYLKEFNKSTIKIV